MKKILFLFALSLTSCAGIFAVNSYLGMSETEFKKKNVGERLVYAEKGVSAYALQVTVAGRYQKLYYHFSDGKLVEINEGVRQPDIIIQNN